MQKTPTMLSKQQTIRRKKSRLRILLICFFCFIGLVMILESPLTRVRSIHVTGNVSVAEKDILQASELQRGMSLWQVNARHAATLVEDAIPRVDTVQVKTDYWSGAVTLAIKEKPIVAILENKGHYYELLSDGKVYDKTDGSSGFAWPLVTCDGLGAVAVGQIASPSLAQLCSQLAHISKETASRMSDIHLDKYGVATIYLLNHFAVQCKAEDMAKSIQDMNAAVTYFQSKGSAPGLIDMTDGPPYRFTPFAKSSSERKK